MDIYYAYTVFLVPAALVSLSSVQVVGVREARTVHSLPASIVEKWSTQTFDLSADSLCISPNLWAKADAVVDTALREARPLPGLILELHETTTLVAGAQLLLSAATVLQAKHSNALFTVDGPDVRIEGGEIRGTWDLLRQGQPNHAPSLSGVYYDTVNTEVLIRVRASDWTGLTIRGVTFKRSRFSAVALFSKTSSRVQSATGGLIEDCVFDENIQHVELRDGFSDTDSYVENLEFRNCLFDTNAQGDFNLRSVYFQVAYNHIGIYNVALWNTTFDRCTFRNGGRMAIESWSGYAQHPDASARGTYNLSLTNCEFRNIYYRAFSVGWGENFLFEDCVFVNDDTMPDGRPLGEGGGLELSPVKNVTIRRCVGRGFSIGIVGGTGDWLLEDNELEEHPNQPGLMSLIGMTGSENAWDLTSSFEHALDCNATLTIRNNTFQSNVQHRDPAWITGSFSDVSGNPVALPRYPGCDFVLRNGKKRWLSNYTDGGVAEELYWEAGNWHYKLYADNGDLLTLGTVLFHATADDDTEEPFDLTYTTQIGTGTFNVAFWFLYALVNIRKTADLAAFTYTGNTVLLGENADRVGESITA